MTQYVFIYLLLACRDDSFVSAVEDLSEELTPVFNIIIMLILVGIHCFFLCMYVCMFVQSSPVGSGCRICWLCLCRGISHHYKCLGYRPKRTNGKVPVQEFLRRWNVPSLPMACSVCKTNDNNKNEIKIKMISRHQFYFWFIFRWRGKFFLKILQINKFIFGCFYSNKLRYSYIMFFLGFFKMIFTNPSARAGYDTRSIFKRSLTGLNSEFSFS